MGIFRNIRFLAFAVLLALAGCANGAAACFFCGAPVRYIHGYPSSRGPMPKETTFVHKGETVYVDGPASVIAYDGIVIAYSQARVHGYENATIYYYDRALVEFHGPNVRLFHCPGPTNVGWDATKCQLVQHN